MFREGLILEIARAAGREPQRLGTGSEWAVKCARAANHSNGDEHPSCRLNPEKNTWFCDVCQRGGGVKDLAEELGVDLSGLTQKQSRKRPPRAGRNSSAKEKLPLVFLSRGPFSAATARVFADKLGKNYTAESWAAFGALEGVVHPEGMPDRSEEVIAFLMPQGGVHAYRYTRKDKRARWCFANGGKAGLLTIGFEREGVVLLCEGEWDAMRAYEVGFPVATTTGAGVFRPEWASLFGGRDVAIVYDIDTAGRNGSFNVEKSLKAGRVPAINVRLPLSGNVETDGKDLSDYVAVHGAEAFREFIANAVTRGLKADRTCVCVPVAGGPALLTRMEAAFPGLSGSLHAALAANGYLALSGFDRPLAIFLMGPPSSGKTLVVRLFFPHPDQLGLGGFVYRCDDFTKASFVSRAANVAPERLDEIDLLPKLEDRLLLTKELAPIFRGKEDDLIQLFAVLTSVLDGDGFVTAGGSVGTRGYDRPIFFCWLGGTTPFTNQTWRVMSALGPRILFYSTDATEPSLDELIAIQQEERSTVETEIQREVNAFLGEFFKANPPRSVPENAIACDAAACRYIAVCARLTARLRAGLSIREAQDRDEGESRYGPPEKEHEYRLVRTLNRFAKGSALILGRVAVDVEDLKLVRHVALSSGPETRRKIAAALIDLTRVALRERGLDEVEVSVRAIADTTQCSLPTARHYAEELKVLQIAEYRSVCKSDPDGGRLVLAPEFRELAK